MLHPLRRSALVLSCLLIQAFLVSTAFAITSPIGYASTSICSTSPPPLKSGTDPGFPGQWWNPNRYGTGWDIYFSNNQTQVVMYWLTYNASHQPVWLFNGGGTTMDASNKFWAPLYQVNQVVGSMNTTSTQVGYVSIAFVPGSATAAAIRWKWNSVSTTQTYDECIYNFFYGTPPATSGALALNQSFTGSWYNPNQSGWGLDVNVGTYSNGNSYEVDNALIYDTAGNPVWLEGSITNPALTTMSDQLGYFTSKYSLTSDCSKSSCTSGKYIGSLTRKFIGSESGNATLTATQTTGQVIAWPNATYSTGAVPIVKLSDNDVVSVDQTNCQVPAGSMCTVDVSWSSHLTTALVYKRNLTTNTLSSTPLNNLANGQYTDTLPIGADVQYEMYNGTPSVIHLMYTSAEVKVSGPLPLATPVSATPAVVTPPARDSVSDRVGATLANFRVDEGGNATYSIPIQVPPGTAGVAPKLSLSYNSRLPNGVMGPGWSISGASQITRCRQTREDGDFLNGTTPVDGNPPPVNFTNTDRYCMDGVRLMLLTTSTTGYGTDQSLYSPENDPTTLVTAHVSNVAAGPTTFTVQRKDGTTSTYGNTSASPSATITATLPSTNQSVDVSWNLARVQDSAGNYIDYLYSSHPSGSTFPFGSAAVEFVLSQVNYTGHATSPVSSPYASVTFNYTTQAVGQVRLGYQAGISFLQSQRLSSVSVTNNGTMMRYYALTYGTSNSGSGFQQFKQIQECRDSSKAVCFPATTFAWSQANYSYVVDTNQNGPSFNGLVGYKIADVDGDGRQDFVYAVDGDAHCPNNANGAVSAIYVGFLDQSSTHQMALTTANQTPFCAPIDLKDHDQAWYLIDYNSDGKADLLLGGAPGNSWSIYPSLGRPLSNGSVFDGTKNLLASLNTPIVVPSTGYAAGVLADINGDGLPDFIYNTLQGGIAGAVARIVVRQSDGTLAFSDPYNINFTWAPGDTNCTGTKTLCSLNFFYDDTLRKSVIATDVDGDGRADITLSILAQTDNGGSQIVQNSGQLTFNPALGTGQSIAAPNGVINEFYWYQFTANAIVPPNGSTPGSITFAEYWNAPVQDSGGVLPNKENQLFVVDLNGDGLADILYQDPTTTTTYHALINTGNGYQSAITLTGLPSDQATLQFADVNGDGRLDLVFPSGSGYQYVALIPGTSSAWVPGTVQPAPAGLKYTSGWASMIGDFDGDGVPDQLSFGAISGSNLYTSRVSGGGGCTSASDLAGCSRYHAHDVITGFTNGYGAKTTVVYQPLTNNGVYLSGTASGAGAYYTSAWGYGSPVFSVLAPMYVVSSASSSAPVRGNANATSTVYYEYMAARMQAGGRGFLGFSKILTFDGNDEATTGQFVLTQTQYNQSFPFTGTPSHTVRRIYTGPMTSGSAAVDACAYSDPENASGCFGTTVWPAASGLDFGDQTMVVSFGASAVTCSGNGCAPVPSTYCSNPGNVAVYIEPRSFSVPAVPQPLFVYIQATSDTQYDLASSVPTSQVSNYFCYQDPSLSQTNNTDTDLTAATTVTQDGNGNVVEQKFVVNTYNDNAASWYLGRLAHSSVNFYRPGAQSVQQRTTDFTYDPTTGLLISEEIDHNLGANVDLLTMYTLDAYGNRTGAYQCSVDAAGSCVSTSFASQQSDTTVHRYAQTSFGQYGRYSTGSYLPFSSAIPAISIVSRDEFGNPTQQSSINGLIQYSEAGALGRPYFSSDNTGKAATTTFRLCSAVSCPSDAVFRSQTVTVGGPTSWTYFDVLGRAILKVGQAFDANQASQSFSAVCSYFDAHNRPAYHSEPFFLPATINSTDGSPTLSNTSPCTITHAATSTTYDILGRVVQVNDPDGVVVYKTYSGLVTTTSNPRNRAWAVTETYNALGELVSRQDPVDPNDPATGLLVTNGYDSAGNLLTVTRSAGSGNIVTSMTYDPLGRKATLSDPDAGGMSYSYNAAGDVIIQKDAKGQAISLSYDAMGRRWQRTTGGTASLIITDTWNYDGQNGFGLLSNESRSQSGSPTYSRSLTYDNFGRLYQRTTSIAGTAYTETTAYDSHGRLLAQQDASGYSVYPQYSPNGFMREQDDSRVGNVYQLMGTDARGQAALDERAGLAGLSSSYSYDAAGRISTICTGVNCGLQDLSYSFDFAGNLMQRERAVRTAPTIEVFTNDALNRLKLAQLTEIQGVVQGTPQTTQSMFYDQLGNICTKNGTVYSYAGLAGCTNHGSIGSPQAVISAGGNTYGYDADGNQTSGAGRTLTYNAFNQLISASSGSISTAFLYTPEGERFMRTDSSGTTTYYIGSAEKLVTGSTWEIRRYLPGGAIDYVRSSGNNETRYTFSDHLGSLDLVATAAGAIYETSSFDAFGNLRNPTTWSGTGATPSSTTHGFTGHEEIYSLGLTHMNGRVYDPVLGRMLQADPMTGPGNQSLNRYSYVINNPLALTDPSGYNWWHNLDRIAGWATFGALFPSVRNDYYTTLANPYVRMVGAAIAAYFTAGAASAFAFDAGYGAAASYAIGGAAGGFVAGEIQSQGNLEAGLYGAALGGFGNYLAGGTYFGNPIDSAEQLGNAAMNGDYVFIGNAGLHYVMNEAAQYAEADVARYFGVRPEVLNLSLMGLSVLGNDIVGSRFKPGNDDDFLSTDKVGFVGYLNRTARLGILGSLFFDTVDAMLAYQGMPTASFADYVYNYVDKGNFGHPVSGHSLGTLDAIRAVNSGLASSAVLYAVPFGNVAPTRAQVYLGNMDVINGGYLGRLFNWNATMCSTGFDHELNNYLNTCP